jgi:hypothetical protein
MEALVARLQHAAAAGLVGVSFTFIEAEHLPTLDQLRPMVALVEHQPLLMARLVVLAG